MSSSLFLLQVVQAFAPSSSAHVVQTAPHGRGCPAGPRPPLMVAMTSLPNLARLAERSSPPEEVATHAPPADFATAFRQAAASRGAPTSSTLRRNLAQSVERSIPSSLEAAPADASSLEIVTDANFRDAVIASSKVGPVLLEFYGEYCGPCRQCEPALKQLDASFADLKVVKARLNSNPAIEDWLLGEGLKVSKLPTLLLVKDGTPLRALTGKVQILDEASLQGFALDGGFVPHGAVVPTRGAVKHAHDGVVVPTESYSADLQALTLTLAPTSQPPNPNLPTPTDLQALSERQQTRELQSLVSRLRASQAAAPGELATLEGMLERRLQHERDMRPPADMRATQEVVCANGVCQRR